MEQIGTTGGTSLAQLDQRFAPLQTLTVRQKKKWTEILWSLKGNWRNKDVTLPVTDAGIYLVEVEHDDITFSVTVLVNRYGLVTKQAAGELIVFAQDRVTGEPAAGMRVRQGREDV